MALNNLSSFQKLKQGTHSAAPLQDVKKRSASGAGLTLDYTRTAPDNAVWQLLFQLLDESHLADWRDKLFAGEKINNTENRAAWHTHLRAMPLADDVATMHKQMQEIAADIQKRGITDVVSIGIGGSDLGPRLAVEALWRDHAPGAPRLHFLHNVDPCVFEKITRHLKPETTAFILSSKSFSTEETLLNADAAKKWLGTRTDHLYAATTKPEKAIALGVPNNHIAKFEEWVGGRFSVWSSVGLPVMLAIGQDGFQEFLAGAEAMDEHFKSALPHENLPILLALLTIYHRNLCHCPAEAVIPYLQDLALLPDHLQQLIMESNGKSKDRNGAPLAEDASPIIFGGTGTNVQHSFFQALHQGTTIVPVQIILQMQKGSAAHDALFANAIAQANAFAENFRPCSVIYFDQLNARTLGGLIALYEHMVFVQGILWGINSFDQPGVELGKKLASGLKARLREEEKTNPELSTDSLIHAYKFR